MHRLLWALPAGLAAAVLLTGCSSMGGESPAARETADPPSTERSQEQKDALLDYVEAERSTIPNLLASQPGVYSEVTVDGTFETVEKNRHLLPDGIHAVVWFDYTYVPDYDLPAAYQQIEAYEAQIDQLCETSIFPRMRALGVDPPLGATFTYHAAQTTIAPLNTLWCSTSH